MAIWSRNKAHGCCDPGGGGGLQCEASQKAECSTPVTDILARGLEGLLGPRDVFQTQQDSPLFKSAAQIEGLAGRRFELCLVPAGKANLAEVLIMDTRGVFTANDHTAMRSDPVPVVLRAL